MKTKPDGNDRSDLSEAWAEFREAMRELAAVDRERARLYLQNAVPSIRSWTNSLKRGDH